LVVVTMVVVVVPLPLVLMALALLCHLAASPLKAQTPRVLPLPLVPLLVLALSL
jgi:hypothetical protein